VFGIANLAAFLFAPIFGRWGSKIGPKLLYNAGAFLQGFCGIAFGFLTYVNGANLFIGLSYLLRFNLI
jgi:MFS family permease